MCFKQLHSSERMQVAKCDLSAVVCGSALLLQLLLLSVLSLVAEAAQGVLPHVEETCESSRVLRFEEERFNSIISEDATVETLVCIDVATRAFVGVACFVCVVFPYL